MLAPNPVKALLGHPEGDDDVDMVAVVLYASGSFSARRHLVALVGLVIDQIGDLLIVRPSGVSSHQLEAGLWVRALPVAQERP